MVQEEIQNEQSRRRKTRFRKRGIIIMLACILLIICMMVVLVFGQILPLYLLGKNIKGKGKCHLEIECHITENIGKYLPYLYYMGINVEKITVELDKDGSVYHGTVYVNDSDRIALEFYNDNDDTVINVSRLIAYIACENQDILPDKLTELLDIQKNIYMTTDSIEELVGSSDVSIGEEILKLVEVHGVPSFSIIEKNMFSGSRYLPALKFASGKEAVIKLHSSMGILNHEEMTITGVRSKNSNRDDFCIRYRKDSHIEVNMPKNSISKMEVIIAKKILKELAETLSEKIAE